MTEIVHQSASFDRGRKREAREFQIVLAVTFLIFLVPVIIARLVRAGMGQHTTKARRRSIFREAWEKANACIGISFMS